MTIAVDLGRKATKQTNKQNLLFQHKHLQNTVPNILDWAEMAMKPSAAVY